jgi:CHAT domain-containing protein
MDRHVSGCQDCYEVYAETARFVLDQPRWRFNPMTALALAAAILLGLSVPSFLYLHRAPGASPAAAPLVAELAQAVGSHRLFEPRLTGGFQHGRLITLRSGETPQGLDSQPPGVLMAVAHIRQRADSEASPEALGALGVTYLVSGDANAAVKSLESASAQRPEDVRLLSDLAAAYLVRASQADEPADIPKALETAERAIARKDAPAEAWFNRALALEGLHLTDAARKAWADYLERDPSSGWADEARQHLEALPKGRRSSAEEEKTRVRAALEGGQPAIDRLADEEPQVLRGYFENDLLPAWAEAHLVGHPDANVHRAHARLVGEALFRATSDAMPRDAAFALSEPAATAGSRDPLRSQAVGYRSLREANQAYERQEPSCQQFSRARADLETGGSPYATWAAQQVVTTCLLQSQLTAALAELDRLESIVQERGYVQLLGRTHWLQALVHTYRGELTLSVERYRLARENFRANRDVEGEVAVLVRLAEDFLVLGDRGSAWRYRQQAFSRFEGVRIPRRRTAMLGEASAACMDERMPRTALHFETSLVESETGSSGPAGTGMALVRRAGIRHALGATDLAAADLSEARAWIPRVGDAQWAERLTAEADALEGEIQAERQPETAASVLGNALAYFKGALPARVPALHLLLARAQMAEGKDAAAENELLAAIQVMERERTSLRDAALQVSFFDQALPLFEDMVRLQVEKRHDPERALAFVERGHARQLADALAGASVAPLAIEVLRRDLPDGLALIYYLPLDDGLFAWALTRGGSHFIERSLPAAELSRLVAANLAATEERAPLEAVHRAAARLHDELVRPFIPFIASQRALVFVSDGILQSVAFASLWDRETGRYLVEDYLLGVAPSGSVFTRASTSAAARRSTSHALVVGNPHFDRRLWRGLSDLPGAESEAGDVARLYPGSEILTGREATKAAFLTGARLSEVVHYAGHAAASADAPAKARLLFSPDPREADSGALYLSDLGRAGLPRTRVVVLAACRSAGGAVSRVEGALSLGRPFLAAGVPDVVGSLWDIDDSTSHRFFVDFHRALLAEGDPVVALRKAQIAHLRSNDSSLSHPASWAAFICMGGLDSHSLSKGETS